MSTVVPLAVRVRASSTFLFAFFPYLAHAFAGDGVAVIAEAYNVVLALAAFVGNLFVEFRTQSAVCESAVEGVADFEKFISPWL